MNKIDLKKLINFKGNRFALTKACSEYAKKVRYLHPDDYEKIKNRDSVLSLDHVLNNEISYTLEKSEYDDELDRDSLFFSSEEKESQETEKNLEDKQAKNPEN